jgi:DnaJ family protein C protein 8
VGARAREGATASLPLEARQDSQQRRERGVAVGEVSSQNAAMAGASDAVTLVPAGQEDAQFNEFMEQVKVVQNQSTVAALSGAEHIARLHRPGSKYFNMNPFEVLGLDHKASPEEVRSMYRKLSVKVHPDKNMGNELAQSAFEKVKAAAERLDDEERMTFCVRICQAAEAATVKKVESKKKKLRKEAQDDAVPEDDPDQLTVAVKIMISRMFAEFEQRRKQLEKQDAEQRKKAKDEQAEREFMEALKKREEKLWEKSRQKRVNGWRAWAGSTEKGPKRPKIKEEQREGGSYNEFNEKKGDGFKKDWR